MKVKVWQSFAIAMTGSLVLLFSGRPAVAAEGAVPFKLGTFQAGSKEFLGLVLQDTRVLDIAGANAAFEKRTAKAVKIKMPADMNELIAR